MMMVPYPLSALYVDDLQGIKKATLFDWKIRTTSDTDSGKFRTVIPVFFGQ